MRYLLVICLLFCTLNVHSQDTTSTVEKCNVSHEFGINSTLLLKQVFNLSNNTFPTLPYNLTYKMICNSSAIRFGLGFTINNLKTTNPESTPPSGPDPEVPTYSNSSEFFYRGGWEKRFSLGKRLVAFGGLDIAGKYGTSGAQVSFVFNNLPNSYSYSRTTISGLAYDFGGGPVGGIQVYLSKRFSLSTEIPIYFMYKYDKEVTENYSNVLQFTGEFVETTSRNTIITSGMDFTITLPVTLYMSVLF